MFVGREEKLALLQHEHIGKAVMVYGKRRVGKTTLILKALEQCPYQTVYFECLKGTMQENIDGLVQELVRVKILPVPLAFSSLQDVFAYLNTLTQKMLVVVDEYTHLYAMNDSGVVDSVFQCIIDNRLSNIKLILASSLKLDELNYLDTSKFYPDKSAYDKVAHYAVFGGSPFINQALNPAVTLRENIIGTILNPMSPVYLYASQLVFSDNALNINAERIFSALGNDRKRYTEIEDALGVKKTGNLAKQIKTLTDLDILSRRIPINKPNDNKKATYELNDNLLRFYYAFVYKNSSALQVLGAEAFYDEYVAPVLTHFIAHHFEDICREYFSLQVRSGRMNGVRSIGSYYLDTAVRGENKAFSVAVELADGYAVYLPKYSAQPMTLDEIHGEAQRMEGVNDPGIKQLGFISINGFVEQEKPYIYLDDNDVFASM